MAAGSLVRPMPCATASLARSWSTRAICVLRSRRRACSSVIRVPKSAASSASKKHAKRHNGVRDNCSKIRGTGFGFCIVYLLRMKTFSITESFKFGWNKLKAHSRLVFSATLILAAIQLLVRLTTPEQSSVPAAGIMIFGAIIEVVLGTGFTIIALKLARGQHTTFREIIPSGRLLWQYIATAVLVGLMMLVCVGIPVGVGVLLMLGGGGISGLVIGG